MDRQVDGGQHGGDLPFGPIVYQKPGRGEVVVDFSVSVSRSQHIQLREDRNPVERQLAEAFWKNQGNTSQSN